MSVEEIAKSAILNFPESYRLRHIETALLIKTNAIKELDRKGMVAVESAHLVHMLKLLLNRKFDRDEFVELLLSIRKIVEKKEVKNG